MDFLSPGRSLSSADVLLGKQTVTRGGGVSGPFPRPPAEGGSWVCMEMSLGPGRAVLSIPDQCTR